MRESDIKLNYPDFRYVMFLVFLILLYLFLIYYLYMNMIYVQASFLIKSNLALFSK